METKKKEELPEYLLRAEAVRAVVSKITHDLMQLSNDEFVLRNEAKKRADFEAAIRHAERSSAFGKSARIAFEVIKRGLY
jgi:hypothetical protein